MTNAAHTPGPWKLENPEMDGEILVTDEQDVTIATVWKQPLDPAEWAEANSRLIAAAPEMLDALRLCEDALSDLARIDDGTPSVSALNMARDAIAKAEGGSI